MTNLTPQEQQAWAYYRSTPYAHLTPEHQQYYDYLLQKQRVPISIEKGSTHPTKKLKKPKTRAVVRKSDSKLGVWLFGALIMLMCLRVIYNEYQNPRQQQDSREVAQKRR